jgi:hypothetical protein
MASNMPLTLQFRPESGDVDTWALFLADLPPSDATIMTRLIKISPRDIYNTVFGSKGGEETRLFLEHAERIYSMVVKANNLELHTDALAAILSADAVNELPSLQELLALDLVFQGDISAELSDPGTAVDFIRKYGNQGDVEKFCDFLFKIIEASVRHIPIFGASNPILIFLPCSHPTVFGWSLTLLSSAKITTTAETTSTTTTNSSGTRSSTQSARMAWRGSRRWCLAKLSMNRIWRRTAECEGREGSS